MIKVCVNGALGRMGSTVCQAVDDDSELELTNSIDINSNQDKTINGQNIYLRYLINASAILHQQQN